MRRVINSKRFWQNRENQCEACGTLSNYRQDRPRPGIRMDRAHLVSFLELQRFGDIGIAFNTDEVNFAALCQRCHAAFDMWCGVMPPYRAGHKTRYFDYERLLPILRRRSKLLQVLISLVADPHPDALETV